MNPQAILQHPEAIQFSENQNYKNHWQKSKGRAVELPSGHHVFYGEHGQRILLADPDGHPLHECLWGTRTGDLPNLLLARIRLDWGQWIGIKPCGLVNTIVLDLSKRPGWEQLTRDHLREMAARAMNADLAAIKFFYRDEDIDISSDGKATIRQVKDTFYVLHDSSFEGAKFMSCMSSMEWGRIDYLPVVELFLSLLPGTGSATFELIRGLYDDQQSHGPSSLQYRGIPPYPSVGAFRLFNAFFTPTTQTGETPQDVFLDVNRSHEVEWKASPEYPKRYFDGEQRLGVTVTNHKIQKVTLWDDSAGLSYLAPTASGEAKADGRGAQTFGQELHLYDAAQHHIMKTRESWQLTSQEFSHDWKTSSTSWRVCFPKGSPQISPSQAFSTVLLYPENSQIIGDKESQPFIFDYLEDFLEEQIELQRCREMAEHLLVVRCEANLGACLKYGRPQRYTIWYEWAEFAQKHAQQIWNRLHRQDTLAWLPYFQFYPIEEETITKTYSPFDWMNVWIPFSVYDNQEEMRQWCWFLANHLVPGGIACVAGPTIMRQLFQEQGFMVIHAEQGEFLPTFKIHQAILQSSRLHPELMIWIVQQS